MKLFKLAILLSLFLNAHLVPFLDNFVLGLIEIHKAVADSSLALFFSVGFYLELGQRVVDLSTLILCEEQYLVGTLDKDFLTRPQS